MSINVDWSNLSDLLVTGSGTGYWDAGVRIEGDNVTVSNVLATGNRYPLIRRVPFSPSCSVGKFYFDTEGFRQLNNTLVTGPIGDVVVLDEIGRAELHSRAGLFPSLEYFAGLSTPLILVVRDSAAVSLRQYLSKNKKTPSTRHYK